MCGVNLTAVQKLISDIGMYGQIYLFSEKTLLHPDFQRIETLHNSMALKHNTVSKTRLKLELALLWSSKVTASIFQHVSKVYGIPKRTKL